MLGFVALNFAGKFHLSRVAVQVWDFKGCELKSRWEIGCSLVKIVYHRLNGSIFYFTFSCEIIQLFLCVCVCVCVLISLSKFSYHTFPGLLATVADDLVIHFFDVVALRMVQKFEGHKDRVTYLCFNEDEK